MRPMKPLIDPRRGDLEDDASSTKRRSLLALAGSLLSEISLPKLVMAWVLLLIVPAFVLGVAPLVASAWASKVSGKISYLLAGIWSALFLAILLALGWFLARPLLRLVEKSFWSLHSLAVEPGYAAFREGLQHLLEQLVRSEYVKAHRAALRAGTALGAGILICALALAALMLAWPASRWAGDIADFASPGVLASVALANSVALLAIYLAAAALGWAIADATMDQPRDFNAFSPRADAKRAWRIGHLSDLHVVGERYGFRIESGRAGPRGNQRVRKLFARLDAIHASNPLDVILVTGDLTDAGRSAEWAEFLGILAEHPRLAERMLVLPGNHDLNVVDRANPARLDLPTSPKKRLREMRALSAIAALQGPRVRVLDRAVRCLGATLADALRPHGTDIARFADAGRWRLSLRLGALWADVFPMIVPPDPPDGLGIVLLNSNAETHFSFTNALGLISTEQVRGIELAAALYPRACWLIALHHHVIEYPRTAKALSERIGTALINGNWFIRRLSRLSGRAVVMHGHRHIDWIGECGGLLLVSAPSPVMEATDDQATYFYIHTLAKGADGRLELLAPERISIDGEAGPDA
jgi:3',5'-cyclic AMP phosphodiesterase CpdA